MSEKPEVKYVVVRENLLKSLIRDVTSFATLASMVGLGIILESDAMQWIGGIIFLLTMTVLGTGRLKRMTPDEAIEYIQSGKEI